MSRPVIRTEASIQLYVLEMVILLQITDTITANEMSVNTSTTAANAGVTPSTSEAEALLPTDITPLYYRLQMEPYLEDRDPAGNNFTYNGHVSIRIQCHNTTNKVTLHVKNLQIGGRINITLFNDTRIETTTTSALTTASSTTLVSGSTYTTDDNNSSSVVGALIQQLMFLLSADV
jgi:hypothetical protein